MRWFSSRKQKDNTATAPEAAFLLPKDAIIHGSMETAIPCLVEGFVEGDVAVKGSVVVRVAAEVRGSVTCDAIEVYGKIGRHIICTGKAVIGAGGFVEGSITAAVTEIDPLAIVNHNTFEEPESAFDDQVIGAVVSPSRAVVNELTWF